LSRHPRRRRWRAGHVVLGLTINYLRSGRALDSYAKASIVKQGRRVVAFEAQAWQDDPSKPIASAFGHFMLRRTPDVDEE
jgi:acyl-coenzyme A thioesterase PaaI-like protein